MHEALGLVPSTTTKEKELEKPDLVGKVCKDCYGEDSG